MSMGGTRLDLISLGPGDNPLQRSYEASKNIVEYAGHFPLVFIPGNEIPKKIRSILTVKGKNRLVSLMNAGTYRGHIREIQIPGQKMLVIIVDDETAWPWIEYRMCVRAR